MGEVPGPNGGNIIIDSGFDDATKWRTSGNCAVSNHKMVYDAIDGTASDFAQSHNIIDDLLYQIKFTVSEVSFANPASGFEFSFGSFTKTFLNPANGLYDFVMSGYDLPGKPPEINIVGEAAGDYCKFDDFEVAPLYNYITETLGIDYPDDKRTELYPGTNADYSQILASRNGKTNVGILFDIP